MRNEKWTGWTFFILASLPFVFPYKFGPFNASAAEVLSGLAILAILAVALLRSGGLSFPLWPSLLLLASCALVVVFGHAYAISIYVLFLVGALLLIASISTLKQQDMGAEALIYTALSWGLICGGVINGIAGILQVFDLAKHFSILIFYSVGSLVPQGQLGQANHYADYLMVAASAAVYLAAKNKMSRRIFYALTPFLVFSLTLSSSRMVLLYMAMAAVLWVVGRFYFRGDFAKTIENPLLALMAFFVLFEMLQYFFPLSANGLARLAQSTADDGVNRWLYYRQAWSIFLQSPLFGVGYGNLADAIFGLYATTNFPPSGDQLPLAYCHNLVLQIISEMGVVGGVIFFVLFVFFVFGMARKEKNPEWFFVVMGGGAIFIHAQLEYPLFYMYFLAIFCCFYCGGLDRCRVVSIPLSRMASVLLPLFGAVVLVGTYYQYLAISALYDPPASMHGKPIDLVEVERIERFGFNPLLQFSANLTMVKYMGVDTTALQEKHQIIDDVIRFRPNSKIIEKKISLLLLEAKTAEVASLIQHECRAYPRSTHAFLENMAGGDQFKALCP